MVKENNMRKFMSRAIVTLVIGAMLTGNASAVSAKELYDARHVCTDVEAGGLMLLCRTL